MGIIEVRKALRNGPCWVTDVDGDDALGAIAATG
jgi:hypothetical protein